FFLHPYIMRVLSSFFHMTLPHSTSLTFFPYTTLFRSAAQSRSAHRQSMVRSSQSPAFVSSSPCRADKDLRRNRSRLAAKSTAARDRKSTRLNSSHLVISYAVFCLKKKNRRIINLNYNN